MKKKGLVLFLVFILTYIAGLFAGAISEVASDNQAEIYDYLEASVSSYSVPVKSSIKGVFEDNIKIAALILLGGLFKISPVVSGISLFLKGYTSGFASVAALRLFGMGGLLLCVANFMSAVLLVPVIALFSVLFIENQGAKVEDKWLFYKRYLIFAGIILVVFAIDTLFRGILSSVCMKFASKILVGG